MTDQMVAGRVVALSEERRGYANRQTRAKASGDKEAAAVLQDRLDAVDAEIERWSSEGTERRPAGRGKQSRVKAGSDG